MIKTNCPRSGLAQRWAPRLRTTFIVVLCFVILTLCFPLGAFASSEVLYDFNGHILPAVDEMPYCKQLYIFYNPVDSLYRAIFTYNGSLTLTYHSTSSSTSFYASSSHYYQIFKVGDSSWSSLNNNTSSANYSLDYNTLVYSLNDVYYYNTSDVYFSGSSYSVYEPPVLSSEYFIVSENNVHDLYSGESLQFYCQTSDGVYAESVTWSIQNVSDFTGLSISSSGLFSVSSESHSPGVVTVQASDINGTSTYCTFDLEIFVGDNPSSGSGGGEGNDGTSEPGNQEVIDEITQGVTDITDGLDDVQSSIDDGFTDMGDKIEDTGNSIVENLLDGLLHLFVPTSEELSAKMDDFKAWIDEKVPLLSIPISVVEYIYDLFFGVTPELGIMTFPQISWMDNVLIEETHLDLSQYSWLNDILPIIRTVATAASALGFINWLTRKVRGVGTP